MNQKYHVFYIIYILMFIFFAVSVIVPIVRYDGASFAEASFDEPTAFESGWTMDDGTSVDLTKLNQQKGVTANVPFYIHHRIPDTLNEGDALYFRSKNIFLKVYIDDTLVYEPYTDESIFYTKSSGTQWNCISLPTNAAGKELTIEVTTVYNSGARARMDKVYIGEPARILLSLFESKLVAFITCILLLFVGFLLMIADIPINIRSHKNHELRYLGWFSLAISIWCLSETNLIQFFMSNSRVMQVVSCSSLMLTPIPLILYLDSAWGFRYKFLIPLVCTLSAAEFVICWVLHFLGIADIHMTLSLTHVLLALSAVILFVHVIRHTFLDSRDNPGGHDAYRMLRTFGLSAISFCTVIDIVRYYYGSGTDSALFVRIGLLIFIICFGCSTLEKTINAVRLGAQTELVSQLAYHDGLTHIGNRTAFEERLAELEQEKDTIPQIGIVMFDVNNLKYVNDNLGHSYGDEMLMKSADIIHSAFKGMSDDCFRIGGDEFVVLITGKNAKNLYQIGIEHFHTAINQFNETEATDFELYIAHGFALYAEGSSDSTLNDIYQLADQRMYENKKFIKAHQKNKMLSR